MTPFFVPYLDVSVEEAVVMDWLKQPGDAVAKGESLVELATEKALFEFESPAEGILLAQVMPSKSTVFVGQCLGYIGIAGEALPEIPPVSPLFKQTEPEPVSAQPAVEPHPETTRIRATPRARRLARELGIDLETLRCDGVIDEEAVKQAASAK